MTIHGIGDREIYMHHAIFAVVSLIILKSCSAALTTVLLITQELSSPFLNVFLLLRAFKGLDCLASQGVFLCFAAVFFLTRVFLNSFGTFWFLREVYQNHREGTLTLVAMHPLEQGVVALAILAGWALQLHWARHIASKTYAALFGKIKSKRKST